MQILNPAYNFSLQSYKTVNIFIFLRTFLSLLIIQFQKIMELVRRRFNPESHDTLQQSVAEFTKIMVHELVKVNFLSFNPRDVAIFCIHVCAMLKNTNEANQSNAQAPKVDDPFADAENLCKTMFGVNFENEKVSFYLFN